MNGQTSLHVAAFRGRENICELLLDHGANVNAISKKGQTPLHAAASRGNEILCKLLLDHGANVNAIDENGRTPLYFAVENGHENAVCKLLVDHGANIHAINQYRQTPLHYAALNGKTETCKMLLDHGANLNAIDNDGETPLHCAAMKGHANMCKLLLDRGANLNAIENLRGLTPLHYAALNGKTETCKMLLDHGENLNAIDKFGWTPLHHAASNGHENLCKLFLGHGSNVNAIDNAGKTPLHLAAASSSKELAAASISKENVCKLLLDHGANLNAIDNKNWTPLHYSAFCCNENVCKLLLDRGANDQLKDNEGKTPLKLAFSCGFDAIVRLLESWTANPHPVTFAATTAPLHAGTAGSVRATASVKAQPVVKTIPFLEDLFAKIDINTEDKAKYKAAFVEHDITSPEVFAALDRDKLRALGVTSIAHQIMFQSRIKEFQPAPTLALSTPASGRPASYVPSDEVREKVAAAMVIARDQKSKFLFFASHKLGPEPEFANNAKVGKLVDAFRAAGATVCYEPDPLPGNVAGQVSEGIQESAIFVAFVTKRYIENVDAGSDTKDPDRCRQEFDCALKSKNNKILTVVMEEHVRDEVEWKGPAGFLKGGLYVDFTSEDNMERVISEMCDRMMSLSVLSMSPSEHSASYMPSTEVREKVAAAMATARDQKSKFLFFASHKLGPEPEFANNSKVRKLVHAFRAAGATVCYEPDLLPGNVAGQVAKGIQESAIFVAFVTKRYIEDVAGGNPTDPDRCHQEFDYAFNNKTNKILPVVMEEQVRDEVEWKGPMGFVKGRLWVDFASEANMDRVISEMCDHMTTLLE